VNAFPVQQKIPDLTPVEYHWHRGGESVSNSVKTTNAIFNKNHGNLRLPIQSHADKMITTLTETDLHNAYSHRMQTRRQRCTDRLSDVYHGMWVLDDVNKFWPQTYS